jgi:hypothetical protein
LLQLMEALMASPACAQHGVSQKCCSVAAVAVSRKCHCRLGLPKGHTGRLQHVHDECLNRHSAIVEAEVLSEAEDLAGIAPSSARIVGRAAAAPVAERVGTDAWLGKGHGASPERPPVAGLAPDMEEPERETSYMVLRGQESVPGAGKSGQAARLFVGVLTAGKNSDRRAAIRDTWGGDSRLHRCAPVPVAAASTACQG